MTKQKPFISIIIPVYNDFKKIRVLLETLITQDYSKENYEIIVVDNNSTDNTLKVVKIIAKNNPKLIKFFTEKNIQSSYATRNKGIKNAKGNLIVFIDSDEWVKKDFLSKIHNSYKKRGFHYLGFKVIVTTDKNNIFEKFDLLFAFNVKEYIEKSHFAPTCALIVEKSVFEKIGYFNKNLVSSGDLDFGNRAHKFGIEQYYDKNIKIYHPARSSLKSFLSKYKRIGKGKAQLKKHNRDLYNNFVNFRYFLPSSPWRVFTKTYNSKQKISQKISILDFFAIYFLYCFVKLTKISSFLKNIRRNF